ncbi:hypothetical protein [Paenibacillus arenilitoris]|uniref:Uncharacterized protein n=1 Tax=Paenibacillus arenilitoris TaxID=2772299 RepID=A0A927CQY3_9BACL|nr:hypothetical protein [Paenibacillus arenilitoris]MBD2872534.1 hypothetical protein [Paenibacillus arenilitoris]
MATDLEFDLKMCGKRVYVTYFELWNKPGFVEQTVREQMRQVGKDGTESKCAFRQPEG